MGDRAKKKRQRERLCHLDGDGDGILNLHPQHRVLRVLSEKMNSKTVLLLSMLLLCVLRVCARLVVFVLGWKERGLSAWFVE